MTTIKLKNGSGAPTSGDLVQGEPALDLTNKRLYTEDSGGTVIEVGTNPGTDVTFADNRKAIFGAGSDLEIYHNGSKSVIHDVTAGNLEILADDFAIKNSTGVNTLFFADAPSGAVSLYHSNAAKLATTSTGIDVTGSVTADSAVIDNITIDGTEIDSSSSLSLDIAGNLTIDVDGSTVTLADGGVNFGQFYQNAAGQFNINSPTQDKDIVFLGNDGGSSIEAMRIDMSAGGKVGIGTSSPAYGLDVRDVIYSSVAATTLNFRLGDSTNGTQSAISTNNNNLLFYADGSNEAMRIDSSGRVGIGTTPLRVLDIATTTGGTIIHLTDDATGHTATDGVDLQQEGTLFQILNREAGDIRFGTDNTERMRIDSSGNVGINSSNPSTGRLVIPQSNSAQPAIHLPTDESTIQGPSANTQIRMGGNLVLSSAGITTLSTAGSERARIDSSGTLNLGTTENVFGGADRYGYNFYANGQSNQSIDGTGGAVVQYINRENADGPFTEFYKDRSKVGSIGSFAGARPYFSSPNTGISPYNQVIYPVDGSGDATNGATDIGHSSYRFKDLYLSGTAYLSKAIDEATLPNTPANHAITLYPPITTARYGGGISWSEGSNTAASINAVDAGSGGALHLAFSTGSNAAIAERMRLDTSGNLLVGTTDNAVFDNTTGNGINLKAGGDVQIAVDSGEALYLNRMGTDGRVVNFRKAGSFVAGIDVTSTTVTYNTSSDQRLKENIVDAPSASDDIDAIQVRSFDWKADGSHQKYGMVAQELQSVAPEAVSEGETEEDMMGVDYSKLVPMLVKEIQSLRARVAQLEGEN